MATDDTPGRKALEEVSWTWAKSDLIESFGEDFWRQGLAESLASHSNFCARFCTTSYVLKEIRSLLRVSTSLRLSDWQQRGKLLARGWNGKGRLVHENGRWQVQVEAHH